MISPDAIIGEGTIIHPGAHIGPAVTIGRGCVIKPGAIIGTTGFGYEQDPDGRWTPKRHEYGVTVGDDVHIGANTCIDRGSWRDTTVGDGARIDNGCHIAHNCIIREHAVIVAMAMLGGSVEIGPGAWIGPNASIIQRTTIGAHALVGMAAVVLKDVPENVTVAGNPARVVNAEVGVRGAM